ncbi:hypothetical protein PG996_001596 [Apiospora saccharicola]|uniref:Uncharacterized protein n=1 Tax=Apiospora saccharicola TaxID=335842 RepID=A0ABR1WH41_9PEZI
MTQPSQPVQPAPDPRLGGRTAAYNRYDIVCQLEAFYDFLPHIPVEAVHKPPPGGWPSLTASSLGANIGGKSPEVVELLRRLPYIDGVHKDSVAGSSCHDTHPWIANEAYPCDYYVVSQVGLGELSEYEAPGWALNVRDDVGFVIRPSYGNVGGGVEAEEDPGREQFVSEERWPPWVVQLTTGTDRESYCWMLDTTDGTVTRYCAVKSEYEPTYPQGDGRAWRDRICDDVTRTLETWWRRS